MVIQCESCSTRFRLPDEKLKPEGVKVRCSHCKAVFTVFPPESETAAPAPEPEPTPAAPPQVQAPAADPPEEDFSIGFDEQESSDSGAFAFDSPEGDEGQPAPEGDEESGKDDFGFDFSEASGEGDGQAPNEFSFDDSGWEEGGEAPAEESPTDEGRAADSVDEFSFDESPWDEAAASDAADEGLSGGPRELSFDESPFADELPGSGRGGAAPPSGKEFRFTELKAPSAADSYGGGVADLSPGFGEELGLPSDVAEDDLASSVPEPPVRRKKSSSSVTLFILLLLLMVVAGAGGFFLWQQGQLPMVDQVLSRFQGGGGVAGRIEVTGLEFAVVAHPDEGTFSVIRGTAINQYPEPRSALQVKGELYGEGGRVLAQQLAYCGNPLDDASLRRMSFEQIREAMSNQFGDALVNLDVPPGKGIPFTVVFKGVPEGLAEFGVSVVDSQQVSR